MSIVPVWLWAAIGAVILAVVAAFAYHMGARVQYGIDAAHYDPIVAQKDATIQDYDRRAALAQSALNTAQQNLVKAGLDFNDQLKAKNAAADAALADANKRISSLHDLTQRLSAASRASDTKAASATGQPDSLTTVALRNFDEASGRYAEVAGLAGELSDQVIGLQSWITQFCPNAGSP